MNNLLPLLSSVLPIIASGLVIIVLLINIYYKLRRKFPVSVNCWFCNSWTNVPYDERESFDCPKCLQYNGFDKNGGYNKIIPEQHDELLNKTTRGKSKSNGNSNGLCTFCNNNQKLKIFQLANFVPMVEENYDKEIEHFQNQLEKAYKLCKKCDKVLKSVIEHQTAWIFGNRLKNLVSSVKLKPTSMGLFKNNWSLILKLNKFASFLLAVVALSASVILNKQFVQKISNYVSKSYIVALRDVAKMTRVVTFGPVAPYLLKVVKVDTFVFICWIGVFLQLVSTIWDKYSATVKMNRALCWIILLLTACLQSHKINFLCLLGLQVLCSLYLLQSSFTKKVPQSSSQKQRKPAMRKIVKNLETTCSDASDMDDCLDEVSGLSKHSFGETSFHSDRSSSSIPHFAHSNYNSPNMTNFGHSNYNSPNMTNFGHSNHKSPNMTNFGHSNHNSPNTTNFGHSNHNSTINFGQSNHNPTPTLISSPLINLKTSLDNLHLSNLNTFSSRPSVFSVASVKRPKPVLSPPKLQTFNQNSWVAGGFWKNPTNNMEPVGHTTNLSRSSSESSGFGSQNNEVNLNAGYSLPGSGNNSVYGGEFDRATVMSEPVYLKSSNPSFRRGPVIYHAQHTFYPNLQPTNMLLMGDNQRRVVSPNLFVSPSFSDNQLYQSKNWSDRFSGQPMKSFRDLSLRAPNAFLFK